MTNCEQQNTAQIAGIPSLRNVGGEAVNLKLGDAVFIFGLWAWLTFMVGPLWWGCTLLAFGWLLNYLTRKVKP